MFNSQGILNKLGYGQTSLIKSIQSGLYNADRGTSLTVDIAISSVDTAKSICLVSFVQPSTDSGDRHKPSIKFINATTIRLTFNTIKISVDQIYWNVIEFYNPKSKQSGVITTYTSDLTNNRDYNRITVSAVDPLRCMVFLSGTAPASSSGAYIVSGDILAYKIIDATTLDIYRTYNAGTGPSCEWQLIEFY